MQLISIKNILLQMPNKFIQDPDCIKQCSDTHSAHIVWFVKILRKLRKEDFMT